MFQMLFGSVVLLPLVGVFERPVFPIPRRSCLGRHLSRGFLFGRRVLTVQLWGLQNDIDPGGQHPQPYPGLRCADLLGRAARNSDSDAAGRRSRRPSGRPAQSTRFFAFGFSFMTTTGPRTVGPT